MKIVFHDKYYNSEYAWDPAAASGRLDGIMEIVNHNPNNYEIIKPEPCSNEDILRAHSERHLKYIKNDSLLYEIASLAAGGAILAAQEAYNKNPTFAVIRPPGHHASADSCWGFCYLNNMSISILKLFAEQKIKSAFVLDFDLHFGDGTVNILTNRKDDLKVKILNPDSNSRKEYLKEVEEYMKNLKDIDIFTASAGFDQGIDDWGHLLHPEDYTELGRLMKEFSIKLCNGRRYAILEGGYNHNVIGKNLHAFCQGFK